jgi:hypothetical protein
VRQKSVKLITNVNDQVSANVKITNHGKGMLDGSVGGPAGVPFSAIGTGPFAFSPGNSRRVKVTFSPTSKGTFSAELTITSDDPDHPSINVPITGTAK